MRRGRRAHEAAKTNIQLSFDTEIDRSVQSVALIVFLDWLDQIVRRMFTATLANVVALR